MIFITKASNDNYFSFTEEENITKLYAENSDFIICDNGFYAEDIPLIQKCFRTDPKQAKKIANCKLQLIIYDDYVE